MAFVSVIGGVILAGGLGFGAFLVLFFFGVLTETVELLAFFGILQFLYLAPLAMLFKKKELPGMSAGLLIGGGLIFLLSSACNGWF